VKAAVAAFEARDASRSGTRRPLAEGHISFDDEPADGGPQRQRVPVLAAASHGFERGAADGQIMARLDQPLLWDGLGRVQPFRTLHFALQPFDSRSVGSKGIFLRHRG
jgi:hypothetical protein